MLLEHMKFFPKGKFDDSIDGLEMAISIAKKPQTVQVKIFGGRRTWKDDFREETGFNF